MSERKYKHDFDAIKAAHIPLDVAQRLNLPLKKEGAAHRCPCPSGKAGERALVITPSLGRKGMYSHGLDKAVSVIDLVSMVQKIDTLKACEWITRVATLPEKSAGREPQPSEGVGFKLPEYLEFEHPEVGALGFSTEDATKLGVAFWPRGTHKGMVGIPLRFSVCPNCNCDVPVSGVIGITEAKLPPLFKF